MKNELQKSFLENIIPDNEKKVFHIDEADFPAKSSGRVSEIIANQAAKVLGATGYSQKELIEMKKKDGGVVFGIMTIFDNKKAIRLNWKSEQQSKTIDSIDFWTKPSGQPHLSADVALLNSVQIVKLVKKVFSGASGEVNLNEEYISEGIKQIKNLLGSDHKLSRSPTNSRKFEVVLPSGESLFFRSTSTMDEMYDDIEDMGIAKYAKMNKTKGWGEGKSAAKPSAKPSSDTSSDDSEKGSGKKVKVKKASKEQLKQDKLEARWKRLFDDPYTEKQVFDLLENSVKQVKSGNLKSLLVTGDPGLGKTFTITRDLAGSDVKEFSGSITGPSALYQTLFTNNNKGQILLFDDLDTLFDDRDSANILKKALDTNTNKVSYVSKNNVPELFYKGLIEEVDLNDPKVREELLRMKIDIEVMSDKKIQSLRSRAANPFHLNAVMPDKFDFQGSIIFISNRYLDQFPESIVSRNRCIEVNLTLDEIVARIERLLDKIEVKGATLKHKQTALKFLKEDAIPSGRIEKMDFRVFGEVVKLVVTGAPDWDVWAGHSLKHVFGKKEEGYKKGRRKR